MDNFLTKKQTKQYIYIGSVFIVEIIYSCICLYLRVYGVCVCVCVSVCVCVCVCW